MHEVGARERQEGAAGKWRDRHPLDDWLGDISDEDWSESASDPTQVRQERHAPEGRTERDRLVGSPAQARAVAGTDAHRAAVKRRRAIAALVVLLLVGLGGGAAALLLGDETEAPVTTETRSTTVTTSAGAETDPAPTTTTTTPTAPSENAATFTLPEGTKLQRDADAGDSDLTVSTDPELIKELQRALTTAGYEPGTPDGIFGPTTEEAVVAFQQANGLSPDGIVGPETADALSNALVNG